MTYTNINTSEVHPVVQKAFVDAAFRSSNGAKVDFASYSGCGAKRLQVKSCDNHVWGPEHLRELSDFLLELADELDECVR